MLIHSTPPLPALRSIIMRRWTPPCCRLMSSFNRSQSLSAIGSAKAKAPGALPWWRPKRDRPLEPPPPAAWIDERGLSTGRDRPPISAAEFLERCAMLLDIPVGRLAVRQGDATTTRLRYLVAGVGIERWRRRPAALAECLGRWPEAVGRWALDRCQAQRNRECARLRVS